MAVTPENLLLCRMRHDGAEAGEKRLRTGPIGQSGKHPAHVVLADGEAGAERIRIDSDAFEFTKQLLESFFL
jgi:hypothetical protein